MKDRPILFAGDMVRAILDGRKVQTRRCVSPQPTGAEASANGRGEGSPRLFIGARVLTCPFGAAGDRLWVRERWGYRRQFLDAGAPAGGPVVYGVDGPPAGSACRPWRPSLHMPRGASRILLEVTACRPQRLHELSAEDARAEGYPPDSLLDPLVWFGQLWDRLAAGGAAGWDANPWVWAIHFRPLPVADDDRAGPPAGRCDDSPLRAG